MIKRMHGIQCMMGREIMMLNVPYSDTLMYNWLQLIRIWSLPKLREWTKSCALLFVNYNVFGNNFKKCF